MSLDDLFKRERALEKMLEEVMIDLRRIKDEQRAQNLPIEKFDTDLTNLANRIERCLRENKR